MRQIQSRRQRAAAMLASVALVSTSFAPGAAMAEDDAERLGLLAYLGLEAADGTTEVKADAGKLEAALLMAPTLEAAAAKLFEKVPSTGKIIPLIGSMKLDLRALAITEMRLTTIASIESVATNCSELIETPAGMKLTATDDDDGTKAKKLDGSTQGVLSSAVALLKTDTTYSAIALTANEQMVLNALVAHSKGQIFQPEDRIFLKGNPYDIRLVSLVSKLEDKKSKCAVKAESKDKKVVAAAKEQLADIDRAMTLANSLIALGEKGAPSLIEQAGVLQMTATEQADLRILRVDISAIGGTMVQRKNVFTTLGLDGGISIRGGVAMSWRLINPNDGYAVDGGTIICASPVSGFQNVYERAQQNDAARCWAVGQTASPES